MKRIALYTLAIYALAFILPPSAWTAPLWYIALVFYVVQMVKELIKL